MFHNNFQNAVVMTLSAFVLKVFCFIYLYYGGRCAQFVTQYELCTCSVAMFALVEVKVKCFGF